MFLLCLTLGLTASGQGKLIIQGKSPFWYVVHTMSTGETFAGVAKKYGVTTDYLRQYNNLQQGYLLAGTKIRIPIRNLTKLNKDGIPVYYQIKKGDNLYQIGQQFNKVSLDFLKNWNNIREEDAREGLEIIVGYIGGYQPIESKSDQNFTAVDAKATGGAEIRGVMKPRGQEKEKDVPKPIDETKLGEEQYIKEEPQKRREIANKPVTTDPGRQPITRPIIVYDNPASVVQQQINEQKNAALEKQDPPKNAVVKTPETTLPKVVPPPIVKKDTAQIQPVRQPTKQEPAITKPIDKPVKKDSVAVAVNKPVPQPPPAMRRDTARKATKADIMLLPVSQEKIIDSAGKLLVVKKDSIKAPVQKPIVRDTASQVKKPVILDTVAAVNVAPIVVKKDSVVMIPVKPVVKDSVVTAPVVKKDSLVVLPPPVIMKKDSVALITPKSVVKDSLLKAPVVKKDSVVILPPPVVVKKDSVALITPKSVVKDSVVKAPVVKKDSVVILPPPVAVKKDSVVLISTKPVVKDSVVKAPVLKKDSVLILPPPAVKKDSVTSVMPKPAAAALEEGFFAQQYSIETTGLKLKTLTLESSIFKTMSGWDDKKYYVLANGIPEGAIVRLTANNKSVCAKVLGSLPAMKGDNGLQMRVSNAAAAALGVEANRFQLMVTYFQ
jgi:LysM repeat protein